MRGIRPLHTAGWGPNPMRPLHWPLQKPRGIGESGSQLAKALRGRYLGRGVNVNAQLRRRIHEHSEPQSGGLLRPLQDIGD